MNQHIVQFYEDDAFLNEDALSFIGSGLWLGDNAVVIASQPRLRWLGERLQRGMMAEAGQACGRVRYMLIDAAEMLSQVMVDEWPNQERFVEAMGSAIRQASDNGKRHVRVFGEMVSMLCAQGKHDAAIRMEELWGRLGEKYRFSMLCAYPLENFAGDSPRAAFHHICAAHSRIVPAGISRFPDGQAELQAEVMQLRQRARMLESELKRLAQAGRTPGDQDKDLSFTGAERREQGRHAAADEPAAGKVPYAGDAEIDNRVRERTARLEKANHRLVGEIAQRRRMEAALQQSQQQLRELALHMVDVIEDERKRIARELHDELGQNLMALRIGVLCMSDAAGDVRHRIAHHVSSALNNIDITIKNVRSIINNLRPAVLDLGLHAAIEWEVREFERRSGIACELVTDRQEFPVDDAHAMALFRILQESLNNVMRHSYANRVQIRLSSENGRICLQVADNGVGTYPGCRRKANTFGLIGIRERACALGGEVSIETDKGKGMTLSVVLPIGQVQVSTGGADLPQ